MMRPVRGLVGLLALAALAACATAPPVSRPAYPRPPARPAPYPPQPVPTPERPPSGAVAWSQLPGWADEDHLGALQALTAACRVAHDPDMRRVCAEARRAAPQTEPEARRFLEANFRPLPIVGDGLLTAYFAPQYEARETPEPPFTAPVRPKPGALDALLAAALADPGPPPLGDEAGVAAQAAAYPPPPDAGPAAGPDRTAIEAQPPTDALAWMRPEDLFFLQIQGSGVLVLPDGRRLKAAFAASNNQPFVGLARLMREDGLIDDAHSSGEAIRAWLADHRGPEADALMRRNPRYVYFTVRADDGQEPQGAAGVSLPAGRALAMDASRHSMGELYWIDAEAPRLSGAFPRYQRLAAALDVGGAIKGDVRADLYMGSGDAAGREAGRVRHVLRLYRLEPTSGFNDGVAAR